MEVGEVVAKEDGATEQSWENGATERSRERSAGSIDAIDAIGVADAKWLV